MKKKLLALALLTASGAATAAGPIAPPPGTDIDIHTLPCGVSPVKGTITPTYVQADDGTITLTSSLGNTIVMTPTQSSIANIGPGALSLDMRAFSERGYTINGYSVKVTVAPTKQLQLGSDGTRVHPQCGGSDGGYTESWAFVDYNPGGFGDSYFSSNDGSGGLGDPFHVDVIGYRDPVLINNGVGAFNVSYTPPSPGGTGGGGGPTTRQERQDSCHRVVNQVILIGAVGCGLMALRNVPGALACGTVFAIGTSAVNVTCDNLQ